MIRFIFGIILGAVVVTFTLQNTEIVQITFLNWEISTSRALIIVVVFCSGIIMGSALSGLCRKKEK